ncbi:hypothetical protein EXN66_Car011156 [Channa argus]|uniref:Uncharacterized protein n=1 Tax=Channa argus TaxID=215402 RepID=A0A6G1PYS1_CHAAH|nr:hypothetical protein EXN66_Car011156 [Channa argus]
MIQNTAASLIQPKKTHMTPCLHISARASHRLVISTASGYLMSPIPELCNQTLYGGPIIKHQ